ncbi:MAG TPA: imidazolonepropionase, partial [Clostridia bacterium]|nr:imidazolonepropionase [Clostridia bacterium]
MASIMADMVVLNAHELITVAGNSHRPKRGRELAEIGIINDGAVAMTDGVIVAVGRTDDVLRQVVVDQGTALLDASGKVVLPGLVDPHTHLVFAGSRENEFEMKIRGASYMDILSGGGGILNTMRATREA